MTSYLEKIQNARSIDKIALYVRAQGCSLIPGLRQAYFYKPLTVLDAVQQYELDARAIERCDTLKLARLVLRERGYFSVTKESTND